MQYLYLFIYLYVCNYKKLFQVVEEILIGRMKRMRVLIARETLILIPKAKRPSKIAYVIQDIQAAQEIMLRVKVKL